MAQFFLSVSLNYTFYDLCGYGFNDFYSIKDILDPKNQVYNKEKDSRYYSNYKIEYLINKI